MHFTILIKTMVMNEFIIVSDRLSHANGFYDDFGYILPDLRIDCISCSLTSNLLCANKVNDYRKCGANIL